MSVVNVHMDVHHQYKHPFVLRVVPDEGKWVKTLIVLLVMNAKVGKLPRQEILNVEIARQVFTRLKQGKDRVNRVNLVPGVIKSAVYRQQIANIVGKVPTQPLQLHHL